MIPTLADLKVKFWTLKPFWNLRRNAVAGFRTELGEPPISQPTIRNIIKYMTKCGFDLESLMIDTQAYHDYVYESLEFYENYRRNAASYFVEKSLEHFVAAQLLELKGDDVYIDIASASSLTPEIYHMLFGCTTYRQDMIYPQGISGNMIGGNAAEMPLEDGFATKMALHCSFEHFEDDTDMRFVKEAYRVLREGGRLCILPLYVFTDYAIQTDPAVFAKRSMPSFESDATIYCARGWGNRHARYYDVPHLVTRIVKSMPKGLALKIYNIENATDVDQSCYLKLAAIFDKRP